MRGCVFDGRKGERGKTVLITTRNEKPAFPPLERKMTIKRKRGHCQVKSRNLCLLFFFFSFLNVSGEINFDMTLWFFLKIKKFWVSGCSRSLLGHLLLFTPALKIWQQHTWPVELFCLFFSQKPVSSVFQSLTTACPHSRHKKNKNKNYKLFFPSLGSLVPNPVLLDVSSWEIFLVFIK